MELLSAAGGATRLHVAGLSMAPLLRPGDVVVVRLGQVQPRLGDVVVRRQADTLVVHRVVKVTGEHILTKGDATLSLDPPAMPEDVLGIVTGIEGTCRLDLSHGVWRALNPALAVYSRLVGYTWLTLSSLRRSRLLERSPLVLRLAARALWFALRVPLCLLARLACRA